MARVYGYIHANGYVYTLYRHNGASAPLLLSGCKTCLGYWESRAEYFTWACKMINADPYAATYRDGETGELLSYEQLLEEEFEELEELETA